MINRDLSNNNHCGYVATVKVIDIEKRYKPGSKHYVYVIQVTWSNPTNTFIIYRRYAQFFNLQCKLLDLFAETPSQSSGTQPNSPTQQRQIPFLPGKIILGRSQIRAIALERKRALNEYCQNLIALPERVSRSRPVLDFFQPSPSDVEPPLLQSVASDKKTTTKNQLVIGTPAKLPVYRCLGTFSASDKTEMSLRRNTLVQIIQKHTNGWWFAQNGDRTGFVPGPYLEPSEQPHGVREVKTFRTSLNETHVVNHTYEAKNRDELSLDKGSFVTVLEKSFTGWWIVKFNNNTGQFPAIYLTSWEGRIGPEIPRKNSIPIPSAMAPTTYFRESILAPTASINQEFDDEDEEATNSSTLVEPILFYAHSDFIDDIGDSVSFQRGEIIEIHQQHSSGWWFGRPFKNKNVLTWIPSNYLQEEPVDDAYIPQSTDPLLYANMPDIVRDHAVEQPRKISNEVIYENVQGHLSSHGIYAKIAPRQKPLTEPTAAKDPFAPAPPPPPPPSHPPVIEEQQPRSASVRDLVKKFSRQ